MILTTERLNLEYITWTLDNGNGRNSDDLRFGQFLHIKYKMDGLTDVFYIESAISVYEQLLISLT
jgi:hypothetical protein